MKGTMLKFIVVPLTFVILIVVVAYLFWVWMFCRIHVGIGQMAIVTSKQGSELSPGQILAKPGQKGVLEEPLSEGRHFLNPIIHEWKIVPAILIPPGKVGIVTSKIGADLPQGQFLADVGQKGVWKAPLGPGRYRLNPEGYRVDLIDAINIPIGYVGVVTSLSGKDAPEGKFASSSEKGVMGDILQPGLYYINPKAYKVDVLEIGLNQVSFTGGEGGQIMTKGKVGMMNDAMSALASNVLERQQQQRLDYLAQQSTNLAPEQFDARAVDRSSSFASRHKRQEKTAAASSMDKAERNVAEAPSSQLADEKKAGRGQSDSDSGPFGLSQFVEFPSRDGFDIKLDMTVEFEFVPSKIAHIFQRYGDLPAVIDKIIMPQIQSVSRIKGSSYRAQDFIVGEGREKFQNELKDSLAAVLGEKEILVLNSLIRHVEVPNEILVPIQQASLAVEQNLTNKARQNTAKKQAELNTVESMIDQKRQEVIKETEKIVAEINAEREKEVASVRANTELKVAEIARETAEAKASVTRKMGDADAKITTMVEGETAQGFSMRVGALGGAEAYRRLIFAEELNPKVNLRIIHAGPGTLWTDLRNAGFGDLGGAKAISDPPANQKPPQVERR